MSVELYIRKVPYYYQPCLSCQRNLKCKTVLYICSRDSLDQISIHSLLQIQIVFCIDFQAPVAMVVFVGSSDTTHPEEESLHSSVGWAINFPNIKIILKTRHKYFLVCLERRRALLSDVQITHKQFVSFQKTERHFVYDRYLSMEILIHIWYLLLHKASSKPEAIQYNQRIF